MTKLGVSNSSDAQPVTGTARWRPRDHAKENRVLDTAMRVTTPENISFEYQIAGPFRRVFAYGIDVLITVVGYCVCILLVYLIFMFALVPLAQMFGGTAIIEVLVGILLFVYQVGYFLVFWFYGAYCETCFNGQTLGKRLTKMRVITVDGHAIDGVQATLRNFFRLLDMMPLVSVSALFQLEMPMPGIIPTGLIGLLIMTLTPKFQRVGDLVAGTVVINEKSGFLSELASFDDARVAQLAEEIPSGYVVTMSMSRALADYVDHRSQLAYQRASEIAVHVAAPLLEKFGLPRDTDHDLFLCALYYKTFITAQNSDHESVLPQHLNPVPANAMKITIATTESESTAEDVTGQEPTIASDQTFAPEDFKIKTD